jgi:hypothetical protein
MRSPAAGAAASFPSVKASLPESFPVPFKYSAKVQRISEKKEYFML